MNNSHDTIEPVIINTGVWCKIQIVSVSYGFSQMLKDGKWVNTAEHPERYETEILTIGKYFCDLNDAQDFMKKKQFKSLLNNIQKNWN